MANLEIKVIAGVLLAALLGLALFLFERHEQQLGADRERAAVATATAAQQRLDAVETERRVSSQAAIAHDAAVQAEHARADAAGAARARDALRVQLNAFVAHARAADPAASAGSAPAGDAIGLLGRLFSESDERSGELAEALDASHAAGVACERSYDSLAVRR